MSYLETLSNEKLALLYRLNSQRRVEIMQNPFSDWEYNDELIKQEELILKIAKSRGLTTEDFDKL